MASALDDITVLDLTLGPAGALCAMFLGDNGARVIRVELPGSEHDRDAPGYKLWDRGKESVVLDIVKDVAAFEKLVKNADVLVESFAPTLDYQAVVADERLTSINPRLVHCSITAYGKSGPLKDEPADDDLVMAHMGILASQPGFREGPVHVVHPVLSVGASLLAAQGIVASLYAREKTGLGRSVETSLMAGALLYAPKVVGEKLKPRPFQLTPFGGGPFYSVFECADGNWLQLGCIHGGFVDIAAAVMDVAHVMMDPKYGDGRMPRDEAARKELFDIVGGVIKSKPCHEWEEVFEAADVPHARACTNEESFDNPQVQFSGLVTEVDDPEVGRVQQMGPPINMTGTPGRVKGPRAVRGANTDKVLSELSSEDLPEANPSPQTSEKFDPPLKGVKVLDMTNVIAGPTGGKLLADLGADVIKLEPLTGEISRPAGAAYFLYLNSNKRSVSINTRTPEGKEAARRIGAEADIFFANMRPGATERMGFDPEWVREHNPGVIQTHVTAFGWEGPFSHRPGVDPLAQAWMGLQKSQGGPENPPVFLAQLAPTDFTAGAMGALGAVMALYVKERTGKPQNVYTNLLNAGALLSYEGFMKYEGKPARRLADKGQYGLSALHRLYETKDDWIYVSAEAEGQWPGLCEALDTDDLLNDKRFLSKESRVQHDAALSKELEPLFKQRAVSEWSERLKDYGIPFAPVINWMKSSFFDDQHIADNDLIAKCVHPNLGEMKYVRNGTKFGNTRHIDSRCTPLLGEHTREALEEVGYSKEEIDELYEKEIAVTEKPSDV